MRSAVFNLLAVLVSAGLFSCVPAQYNPFSIVPYEQHQHGALVSDAGVRSCGGTGLVLARHHQLCHTTAETAASSPCVLPSDVPVFGQVVFVPRTSTQGLRIRLTSLSSHGDNFAFEKSLPEIVALAGEKYVLNVAGGALSNLKGKLLTSQLQIFRESDNQLEICSLADFYVA